MVKNKFKEWKVSSIEQSFDNILYDSYPLNDYFDDLPIEYKQRLFTKWSIFFV